MTTVLHPWNHPLARRFVGGQARLSHAMLFAGPAGLGKEDFAIWLAQRLLCSQPPESGHAGCGECQGCRLFAAGSHPDLHVLQPEAVYKSSTSRLAQYAQRFPPEDKSRESKDSTAIRIDQVRALIEVSQTRPQIAARKVAILSPADRLNVNAANALLKLLEEPPPDSHLFLVTSQPARLPPTLRSRCLRVDFRLPDSDQAKDWLTGQGIPVDEVSRLLALAGGAPLAAKTLAESGFLKQQQALITDLQALLENKADPVACAARWKQQGGERCLLWLQGWLADLIRVNLVPDGRNLSNSGEQARLHAQQKRLHLNQIFSFADRVGHNHRLAGGSLDEHLLLEDTLIRWTELHKR